MLRSLVFAAVAVLASTPPGRADEPGPRTGVEDAASAHAIPDLHRMLMDKLDAMNAKDEGIFRDDITPSLAPYFPVGQPMAETKRIIAAQKLGVLKPFKGTNDAGMGTMFVSRFDLTSHVFSHVYVVLDFDYDGTAPDMTLKAMKAYLRATNM